ncbi:MAG: M56 family metallopeptidase [Candidatus Aminicenantes bacterium]
MNILNNIWTAEWILNSAVQSFLILFFGWMFCFFFRHRPAPLRSGISLPAMLALVLLLPLSFSAAGFHFNPFHTVFSVSLETLPESTVYLSEILSWEQGKSTADGTAQKFSPKGLPLFGLSGTGPAAVQAANLFGIVWGAGFIIMLLRVLAGVLSVRTLKKESTQIRKSRMLRILNEAKQSFPRRNKTKVYSSSNIPYPMAAGIFKPFILIPEHLVSKLPDNQIRGVLLHELSHIHHRDPVSGMLQRLVKTINWWNPFAYALSRAHARAREEISDNHVLLLQDSKEYAECLINLADKTPHFKHAAASMGMSSCHIPLKDRIKHILSKERTMETSINKRDFAVIVLAALLLLTGITGTRFMFSSDVQSPNLIKKIDPVYPREARQAGIEGTVVIAAYTDNAGNINQMKILKGAHNLLNKAAVEAVIQWKCEPMIIEGISYGAEFTATFRFSMDKEKPGIEIASGVSVSGEIAGGISGRSVIGVVGGVPGGVVGGVEAPVRAVGEIKPPKLIKMVEPVYPEEARRAQVEGLVILEATTGIYGRVQNVKTLRSIPLLDQAAIDAVKKWVYEPMVIDGEPRGVTFTVTVAFKLDKKKPDAEVEAEKELKLPLPPVPVTGDIKPPKLIKKVEPVYPEFAREDQIEGIVILEAATDKYGRVESVRVLKSIPELDEAAVDAVKQWVYEPLIINGEPRGAVFTVTVNFKLK